MAHDHHGAGHHHDTALDHDGGTHLWAEMLDLDADVLHDFHREVIAWAGSLAPEQARVVDLGAGTGTGTVALARQLPAAEVIAVDVEEEILQHLRGRAAAAGVADRVRTVRADLDGAWPDLAPVDLVWASASMHHIADPARALAEVRALLRPGGAFMITEVDSFPRFLSDPAEAAVEERCHAVLDRMRAEAGMHMGMDWAALLKTAGFQVEDERRFDIALRPPLPPGAGRYAQVSLSRAAHRLADALDPDDLAALERLAATVADRDDLTVRATRMVWVARRPAED
jgi:ubiquinone/menaquinone biosynthesis C-methylase UbiE